jgi:uncharacterized membrane protein YcjF (UPF0283 family)
MQLATQGDALQALNGLFTDIANTEQQVINTNSSWFSTLIGSSQVSVQSTSLLTQLTNYGTEILNELTAADPSTPLTAQQQSQLQELQKEVIDDRALIGLQISAVDWTFGAIWSDGVTLAENAASQAVTTVSSAFGINWTYVAIAIGAIVLFLVWRKVG